MSTKENNEVVVEKVTENDKASADAKCDIKGIKRPAEVSTSIYLYLPFSASVLRSSFISSSAIRTTRIGISVQTYHVAPSIRASLRKLVHSRDDDTYIREARHAVGPSLL